MVCLPPELLDRILDYLHDDYSSLGSCALASRILLATARYHRFHNLDNRRGIRSYNTLIPIVAGSPDLASVMSSLFIVNPRQRPDIHQILPLLPALSSVRILGSIDDIEFILPYIRNIRALFWRCGLALQHQNRSQPFIVVLSQFPNLEELYLHVSETSESMDDSIIPLPPPPPRLRKVCFHRGGGFKPINKWLNSSTNCNARRVIFRCERHISSHVHAVDFMKQVEQMSLVMQELNITFKPHGNMDGKQSGVNRLTCL